MKGRIPAGPSGKGGVELTSAQMESILSEGAKAAVELGLGHEGDLSSMESNGLLEGQQRTLSERALNVANWLSVHSAQATIFLSCRSWIKF